MKRIVQQYAQSKFENLSLIDFRPEVLSAYKRCIETGQLDQVDELYKAMYHEWDALQKDVNKVTSALGTLDFRAVPYAADGAAPTPEAEAVAALVNAALWHAPQPGTGEWQHGFAQLPGAIYHALLRGYNVHEIIWAYDGGMYYPAAYLPVMPQFFAWECRSGEPDRLLLYPRGVGFSDGRAFPRHKFIVALNNQGVDHPMENSILRALVPWFCAAVWGPRWLMQYCQIFGLPIRTFRAGSAEERADLESKLAEQPVVTDVVLLDGEEMTVQSPGSSTGLPQRELIELAEKACHKLILGQTLTSDTSDGGSRAQAQVHSEVLKDELMSIGEYVCGVLNAQLVPAIVRMNYGGTQVPMPELRCSLPNAAATRETVELLDGMINRLGMSIRRSDVYDKLGIAMPDPGDDVLGPAMAPAPGRDAISAAAAARYPEAGGSTAAALADAAEQAAESVCRAWSAPVREALAKAAAEGKSPQEMLELLESLRCDTALLAEAQESIMRAGLGLSDEEVASGKCRSADPLHCRVHGIPRRKGTTREYRTRRQIREDKDESKSVYIRLSPVKSYESARVQLNKQMEYMTTEEGKRRGIAGRGAVAISDEETDGVEFFLSKRCINELLSGKHVKRSVDIMAHCTAAANVSKLWKVSQPVRKRQGRKGERDRFLKYIHVRRAYMKIGRRMYAVQITAKEFVNPTDYPVLYQVRVEKRK